MKPPIFLKTIIDICFLFLIISFTSSLFITVFAIVSGESSVPITINESILSEFTPEIIILLFLKFLIAGLTIYTVFLLRRLIRNFFKGKFFTNYQIRSLRKIGSLIVLITISEGFLNFIVGLLPLGGSKLRIGQEFSFTSFWFILAIGLFFIYLSKIFNNARIIQAENELTV